MVASDSSCPTKAASTYPNPPPIRIQPSGQVMVPDQVCTGAPEWSVCRAVTCAFVAVPGQDSGDDGGHGEPSGGMFWLMWNRLSGS